MKSASIRIRMEFTEMPEMRLTRAQVRRVLNLPGHPCDVAFASLVESGFLILTDEGAFLRPQSMHATDLGRVQLAPVV